MAAVRVFEYLLYYYVSNPVMGPLFYVLFLVLTIILIMY